jgi:hypothetical protein
MLDHLDLEQVLFLDIETAPERARLAADRARERLQPQPLARAPLVLHAERAEHDRMKQEPRPEQGPYQMEHAALIDLLRLMKVDKLYTVVHGNDSLSKLLG